MIMEVSLTRLSFLSQNSAILWMISWWSIGDGRQDDSFLSHHKYPRKPSATSPRSKSKSVSLYKRLPDSTSPTTSVMGSEVGPRSDEAAEDGEE